MEDFNTPNISYYFDHYVDTLPTLSPHVFNMRQGFEPWSNLRYNFSYYSRYINHSVNFPLTINIGYHQYLRLAILYLKLVDTGRS